ncbi:MAG: alpha-ketoglutarate-dependent dioxygenase AlkB, partial [Pseudomonas sp.]
MRSKTLPGSTADLFADEALQQPPGREQIGEQSYVLRGYALPW